MHCLLRHFILFFTCVLQPGVLQRVTCAPGFEKDARIRGKELCGINGLHVVGTTAVFGQRDYCSVRFLKSRLGYVSCGRLRFATCRSYVVALCTLHKGRSRPLRRRSQASWRMKHSVRRSPSPFAGGGPRKQAKRRKTHCLVFGALLRGPALGSHTREQHVSRAAPLGSSLGGFCRAEKEEEQAPLPRLLLA
ncbi:hypothetical protein MRX96_009059 [Rhipicephalus microplus]